MTFREGAGVSWPAAAPSVVEMTTDGEMNADSDLPGPQLVTDAATPPPSVTLPVDLPTMLREIETAYINAALAQTRSNKKEAAKLLGMGRTTLVEKLRRRSQAAARGAL
jgi:DNA-binding NtrC family response regulator